MIDLICLIVLFFPSYLCWPMVLNSHVIGQYCPPGVHVVPPHAILLLFDGARWGRSSTRFKPFIWRTLLKLRCGEMSQTPERTVGTGTAWLAAVRISLTGEPVRQALPRQSSTNSHAHTLSASTEELLWLTQLNTRTIVDPKHGTCTYLYSEQTEPCPPATFQPIWHCIYAVNIMLNLSLGGDAVPGGL